MSHKLLVKDQNGEREVLLIDTVAVGRDPRCDISLADPLLSRRHAEFVASDRGVFVRDLKSRNGILVNGRRLQEAELHPGDVVQISQVAVTFLSSADEVTIGMPRPVQRRLDWEAEPGGVPPAGDPLPHDGATSLLTPAELKAAAARSIPRGAAAASGEKPQDTGRSGVPDAAEAGHPPGWSVEVSAHDDRTNVVPQPAGHAPEGSGASQAVTATADAPALPAEEAAAPGAAVPTAAIGAAAAKFPAVRTAVPIVVLAALCFVIGVGSTIAWLGPARTGGWSDVGRLPAIVLACFVLAVAGGVAVSLFVVGAARRHRTGREMPVPWQAHHRG